jgi:hypothetical protein
VREPTIVIGGVLVGLATAVVDGVASNRHRPLGCGEEPSDHNSRVPARKLGRVWARRNQLNLRRCPSSAHA